MRRAWFGWVYDFRLNLFATEVNWGDELADLDLIGLPRYPETDLPINQSAASKADRFKMIGLDWSPFEDPSSFAPPPPPRTYRF